MGRWSQRQRRGSAGPVTAVTVAILTITRTGFSTASVLFSGPVSFVASLVVPALTINGMAFTGGTAGAPNTVDATFAGAIGAVGTAWALAAQPSWIAGPVAFPANGITV